MTVEFIISIATLVGKAWDADILGFRRVIGNARPYKYEAQVTQALFHKLFDGTEYSDNVKCTAWGFMSNEYEYLVVCGEVGIVALSEVPYEDLRA